MTNWKYYRLTISQAILRFLPQNKPKQLMKAIKNRFSLDEPEKAHSPKSPARRKHLRFRLSVILGALLLVLISSSIVFFYLNFSKQKQQSSLQGKDSSLWQQKEELQEPYYLPQKSLSPRLREAISHYHAGELQQAQSILESIQQGPYPNKEKAIALIYLGIMAMVRGHYELARHHLLGALHYNKEAVEALVNLAILEQRLNHYDKAREYALQARRLAPNDSHVLLLLGNTLFKGRHTDDAINTYERALSGLPEDAFAYYNLALSHLRKANKESAIQNFKRAIQYSSSKPLLVRAHAHLAQLFFQLQRLELALDHMRKAVSFAPRNAKYLYNLGVMYLYKHMPEEALSYFHRALQSRSASPAIYRSIAKALERLKKHDLAIEALKQALAIDSKNIAALFQLAQLQHRLGYLEQAAQNFQNIITQSPGDTNTQNALRGLARVRLDQEQYNKAIASLKRAIQLKDPNPEAYHVLAQVYEISGRRELAIAAWKQALRSEDQEPLLISRKQERTIRMALGKALREEGAVEEALRQYGLVKERNREAPSIPLDPQLNLAIAKTYIEAEDANNSIAPLLAVAKAVSAASEKERKEAWLHLAKLYSEDTKERSSHKALASIHEALLIAPNDASVQLGHAWVLFKSQSMSNREKALEILSSFVHSEHDILLLAEAYKLMGMLYMETGEYRRAIEALDKALEYNPSDHETYRQQQAANQALQKEKAPW